MMAKERAEKAKLAELEVEAEEVEFEVVGE